MYKFRMLEAYYDVTITLTYPDRRQESYHSREHLIARYNRGQNCYSFKMLGRTDIKFNGEASEDVMDKLLTELGDALYPCYLQVNPYGEILQVKYFDEIKERWKKKAAELSKAHHTAPFEKYLQIARKNLKKEEIFRETLLKKTFNRCYFLPENADRFLLEVHHFPQRSDNTLFSFKLKSSNIADTMSQSFSANTLLPAEKETTGQFNRSFTDLGDLDVLWVEMQLEDAEGQTYKKTIEIRTDRNKREILKANKMWSFVG